MSKRDELDEKALLAASLARANMSRRNIALYLGFDEGPSGLRQVTRLLARSRQLYKWLARNIDGEMHLGETITGLKELYQKALENMVRSGPGSAIAVGWARVALDALREIKKILQESGFVFKMPETVEEGIDFSDPEIRKEYLLLRAKAKAKAKAQEDEGGDPKTAL
jgi:hypothetical protein